MAVRNASLNRWMRRLWMPLAAGSAAGLGVTGGLIASHGQGSAHVSPVDHPLSAYTYESSDCSLGTEKDPINLIFEGPLGLSQDVSEHAARTDHGWWDQHSGSGQYFWDHGQCQPMDDQSANQANFIGIIPQTRYHMRYNEGEVDGVLDWDAAAGGYYTLAAAHHENGGLTACGSFPFYYPGHAVDGNETNPPGGFNLARDAVYYLWVENAGDGHALVDEVYWGNTRRFEQCDGNFAWSDGIVYYISMPAPAPPPGHGYGTGCGRAIPC